MAVLDEEIDMKKEQIDTERYSSTSKLFQVELGTKLDKLVGSWNDADLEKIVSYLKEWNTNAKHSFVSQALLNRFVTRFNIKLSSIIFFKFIFKEREHISFCVRFLNVIFSDSDVFLIPQFPFSFIIFFI